MNIRAITAGLVAVATAAGFGAMTNAAGALPTTAPPVGNASASAATPVAGGVLNVLSTSGVDYLDPNLTYYTVGMAAARNFSRQLYSYPGRPGQTTRLVPDLATGMPTVTNGGTTFTVTIRSDAQWDTSPARTVTATDEVRGVEMTCNPFTQSGALLDFVSLIKGMGKFCSGFARTEPTVAGIKRYLASHSISGVKAGADPQTVVFTLNHPDGGFTGMLSMDALSPRPVEELNYLPGTTADERHQVADGPYRIASYSPEQSIDFVRNPAWIAASDPVRSAYVDEIKWQIGLSQAAITSRLEKNQPSADTCVCDLSAAAVRSLRSAHNSGLSLHSSMTDNPYLVVNTVSPRHGRALRNRTVRQAVFSALNRSTLIRALGGRTLNPPLAHVLPAGVDGSKRFNLYPTRPSKARRLLRRTGHPHLTLRFLYREGYPTDRRLFRAVRRSLAKAGITVRGIKVPDYLYSLEYLLYPTSARKGKWDLASAGWGPDWYADSAQSIFEPTLDGRFLPPLSSNYGLFNDRRVNALIGRASRAQRPASDRLWARADRRVMTDAAVYPVSDPRVGVYTPTQTHGYAFLPVMQAGDQTNMWLSPAGSG